MIKSKIKNASPDTDIIKYPCLKYIENENGILVVMFIGFHEGFVVVERDQFNYIGEYSKSWDESAFDVYDGSVVMANG